MDMRILATWTCPFRMWTSDRARGGHRAPQQIHNPLDTAVHDYTVLCRVSGKVRHPRRSADALDDFGRGLESAPDTARFSGIKPLAWECRVSVKVRHGRSAEGGTLRTVMAVWPGQCPCAGRAGGADGTSVADIRDMTDARAASEKGHPGTRTDNRHRDIVGYAVQAARSLAMHCHTG